MPLQSKAVTFSASYDRGLLSSSLQCTAANISCETVDADVIISNNLSDAFF